MKKFEIDWDSIEEVSKLFHQVRSRKHHLEAKLKLKPTRMEIETEKFNAINKIMSTNIDDLYSDYNHNTENKFYVYCHMNPEKPLIVNGRYSAFVTFSALLGMSHSPFYIGKGTGNRLNEINRNETHRKVTKFIRDRGKDPLVYMIKDNLSEKDALIMESKLIDIYGLDIYNGSLTNLDEGIKSLERRNRYADEYNLINKYRINSLKFKKRGVLEE